MAFQTNGSSHKSGVAREKQLASDFQNNKKLAEQIVNTALAPNYVSQHIGGTKNKEDITITSNGTTYKISLKKKKDANSGSFDWANSAKAAESKEVCEFKNFLKECRENFYGQKNKVKHVRSLVNNKSNDTLNNMTSTELWNILEEIVIDPYLNNNLMLLVDDVANNKKYCIDSIKDTKLYDHYLKRTPLRLISSRNAKSSRTIMFGQENLGLRIRVVSNNGIKALLGAKNAVATVKVQQDNIPDFIQKCKNVRVV